MILSHQRRIIQCQLLVAGTNATFTAEQNAVFMSAGLLTNEPTPTSPSTQRIILRTRRVHTDNESAGGTNTLARKTQAQGERDSRPLLSPPRGAHHAGWQTLLFLLHVYPVKPHVGTYNVLFPSHQPSSLTGRVPSKGRL